MRRKLLYARMVRPNRGLVWSTTNPTSSLCVYRRETWGNFPMWWAEYSHGWKKLGSRESPSQEISVVGGKFWQLDGNIPSQNMKILTELWKIWPFPLKINIFSSPEYSNLGLLTYSFHDIKFFIITTDVQSHLLPLIYNFSLSFQLRMTISRPISYCSLSVVYQ